MKDPKDVLTRELIAKRGRPKSGTAIPGKERTRAWRDRRDAKLATDPARPVTSDIIDLSEARRWPKRG